MEFLHEFKHAQDFRWRGWQPIRRNIPNAFQRLDPVTYWLDEVTVELVTRFRVARYLGGISDETFKASRSILTAAQEKLDDLPW
jgi:hypothetical protein